MELWDILDENGNFTGRTIQRGERLNEGDYHLVVHIWIINDKGELLIQKRVPNIPWANMWAATGGSAVAGEDSITAAIRETKEELGIQVCPEDMNLVERIKRADSLADVWLVKKNIDIDAIQLQAEEVSEAKWVSREQLVQLNKNGQFFQYSYITKLLERICES